MRLKVDAQTARRAIFLTGTAEYGDERRYYEVGAALIVCRNGYDLIQLIGQPVDANVGWDKARPGFTASEARIGKKRTKVTIYKPINKRTRQTLAQVIQKGPK